MRVDPRRWSVRLFVLNSQTSPSIFTQPIRCPNPYRIKLQCANVSDPYAVGLTPHWWSHTSSIYDLAQMSRSVLHAVAEYGIWMAADLVLTSHLCNFPVSLFKVARPLREAWQRHCDFAILPWDYKTCTWQRWNTLDMTQWKEFLSILESRQSKVLNRVMSPLLNDLLSKDYAFTLRFCLSLCQDLWCAQLTCRNNKHSV